MGKLKLKSEQLVTAITRLNESIERFNQSKDPSSHDLFRDSMIKRFEFTIDLFWKYIKRYLIEKLKQDVQFNAPKQTILTACKAKLITEEDAEIMLKMIDDRNMTSHMYKEEIANQVSAKIENYYGIIKKYADKLAA